MRSWNVRSVGAPACPGITFVGSVVVPVVELMGPMDGPDIGPVAPVAGPVGPAAGPVGPVVLVV
jgi:hypothetical protein